MAMERKAIMAIGCVCSSWAARSFYSFAKEAEMKADGNFRPAERRIKSEVIGC
jgi:hypothetical protein